MKQKLWCCVKNKKYYFPSLAHKKEDSKNLCRGNWIWEDYEKSGWKCIKVEVEIKPI